MTRGGSNRLDGVPGWLPGNPCPCDDERCTVIAFKLNRFGHSSRTCICRSCTGRKANTRGHTKQARALKDAAAALGVRMDRAPSNEEHARLGDWHFEVKSGAQIPKTLDGAFMRHAERQAEIAADGVARYHGVVLDLPGGKRKLVVDYDAFLRYVAEQGGAVR